MAGEGITDGLAISSGANRGEAAYLGDSSWDPVRYSENLVHIARQEKALKDKKIADNAALLTDETKAQWATDDLNYIQPKLAALKEKTINLFKQTGGNLNPLQIAEIKNEQNKLHSYVTINNKLRENYINKVKQLDEDKTGAYNRAASIKLLETWNNPTAVPELKQQIDSQYGGDVNAWRAANEQKFQLIPAYNEDKYYSDVTKDEKPAAYQKRDANGKIIYETLPTGEKAYYEGKRLTAPQVSTLTNRVWNGTEYKDARTKEMAIENVQKMFSIDDSGRISFNADLPPADKQKAQRIITNAGDMKGLSTQEMETRLAKGYIATQIESKNGEGESLKQIGFAPVRQDASKKETSTIATHYSNIASQIQQQPSMSPDQVAEQLGGTARVNPRTGLYSVELPVPPGTKPFVSLPSKKILTLQNRSYRPSTGLSGQVAGTVAGNELMWKKNGTTVTPNTPGAVPYGQITYNPVTADNDNELTQAFALFTSANPGANITKEVYRKMLDEGKKAGSSFKVEYDLNDPVQRTYYDQVLGGTGVSQTAFNKETKVTGSARAKQPSAGNAAPTRKHVSLSTLRSKVGQPGFEGYTEKELIDYYTSQGYKIK